MIESKSPTAPNHQAVHHHWLRLVPIEKKPLQALFGTFQKTVVIRPPRRVPIATSRPQPIDMVNNKRYLQKGETNLGGSIDKYQFRVNFSWVEISININKP